MIDLTPRTPYRQRTGILFGAVMIGHLILISAQVQSKAGVPVLEGVTFGVFSRIQGGAAGFFRGIGGTWSSYVALRGVKAENEALRQQVAGLEVRLQEQRALAARAERLQALLNLRESTDAADAGGRSHRRQPESGADDGHRSIAARPTASRPTWR